MDDKTKINTLKLIRLEMENRQEAIELCPDIIAIIPKFNGKMMNKRFDTALKTINKGLSFDTHFNSFIIKYYPKTRHIADGEHALYVKESNVSIVHASIQSAYGDGILQRGTLEGETLKKRIESFKTESEEYLKKLGVNITNINAMFEEYELINNRKDDFNKKWEYSFREYFKLKV